jgi:hypothetical protein
VDNTKVPLAEINKAGVIIAVKIERVGVKASINSAILP